MNLAKLAPSFENVPLDITSEDRDMQQKQNPVWLLGYTRGKTQGSMGPI